MRRRIKELKIPGKMPAISYLEGRVFATPQQKRDNVGFYPGHDRAKRENMPVESHANRMVGLFRTWSTGRFKREGKRLMPVRIRRKIGVNTAKRHRRARQDRAVKSSREIQQIALDNAKGAMEVAVDLMYDRRARGSERLAAVDLVLNRAAGRPTQTNINASVDTNANPNEASAKELDTRIAETLERVEALTGRAPKKTPRKRRPIDLRINDRDPGSSNLH